MANSMSVKLELVPNQMESIKIINKLTKQSQLLPVKDIQLVVIPKTTQDAIMKYKQQTMTVDQSVSMMDPNE